MDRAQGVIVIVSQQLQNQLLVNVGSIVTANGAILLASPPRFARLRTASWTPRSLDVGLTYLAHQAEVGRGIGALALIVGLVMVVTGLSRTRPVA